MQICPTPQLALQVLLWKQGIVNAAAPVPHPELLPLQPEAVCCTSVPLQARSDIGERPLPP